MFRSSSVSAKNCVGEGSGFRAGGGRRERRPSARLTHLLHGELLEHRVVLVQPQPAQPVQDAALLRDGGLRLAGRLGAGLSEGQGLVVGEGGAQVQGERLVVLQAGLGRRRVEQRWAVLLLRRRLRPHGERTLGRQARHRRRGKGGKVGGGPSEDDVVGADDGLNAGHPIYRPEGRERRLFDGAP